MNRKDKIDELLASIRAGLYLQQQCADAESRRQAAPFVTISRQAAPAAWAAAGACPAPQRS